MDSAESIQRVINIIKKALKEADVRAVVVAAMRDVTNQLIQIANLAAKNDESYKKHLEAEVERHSNAVASLMSRKNRLPALANVKRLFDCLRDDLHEIVKSKELSLGQLDKIMSYGERLSARILADALNDRGISCEYFSTTNMIVTDDNFGSAVVDFKRTNNNIAKYFGEHRKLQIATGFISSSESGKTTTLGRGGSDYTASIIGAALKVKLIEIWTGVSGFMTANPDKVKNAFPIESMSYAEASEMSYFGAKVLHPRTIQPALEKNIHIRIKNTFNPNAPGTFIEKHAAPAKGLIRGISSVSDIVILRLQGGGMAGTFGVSGRLFGALGRARVNVVLITQGSSENSISVAIVPQDVDKARNAIETEFAPERRAHLVEDVIISRDLSIITVVGEGMLHRRGMAGRLFQTLGRNGVNIVAIAQGSSELNISAVISKADEIKALNSVHAAFFTPEHKIINIFQVGVGLIGNTLLRQVSEQKSSLEREHGYRIRIAGIADSSKMLFDREGIGLQSWRATLSGSRVKMNIKNFVETMRAMNMPESVFVDCTASENVASHYADILEAGISIVTPNKRANSGTFKDYQELKTRASRHGVKFLYETNVGAGLPVISTLKDLLLSGDEVVKIEAILSGTLSYIFNHFNGKKSFSAIVKEARKLGFTEPDPRSDLDGMDVARKILILAREAGFSLELKDMQVESLLSARCRKAKSIEEFFKLLQKEDGIFEKKRRDAEKAGMALRYIATLKNGRATVSLSTIGKNHPFYSLSGNDNVIAFTTKRYKATPIVIKGPGAGAEVTAAGVFADILRIASPVA